MPKGYDILLSLIVADSSSFFRGLVEGDCSPEEIVLLGDLIRISDAQAFSI